MMLITLLLIACGSPIGEAGTAYEACLDYYVASCACDGDDCLTAVDAAEECEPLLPSECEAGDEAACDSQLFWATQLDALNCYNEHRWQTCDVYGGEC